VKSIKQNKKNSLTEAIKQLRTKAANNLPSLNEITKEVASVRRKRYGKKKR
jgi:hypothetical protein